MERSTTLRQQESLCSKTQEGLSITSIRTAIHSDAEKIAELGKVFFKEAGWEDVTEWDHETAVSSLVKMIGHESCFIYVAEEHGDIVGMIGAIASQIWFSKDTLATELFWYVKPDCRGGIGGKLLDALEAGLRLRGVAAESMTTVDKLKSLETYLKRRGFRPSEHSFIRRL